MPDPGTQRDAALKTAQAAYLRDLAERVADRPPHKTYLDSLLATTDDNALYDIPLPRKVSRRVADALVEDVAWCRTSLPEIGQMSPYPAAYKSLRIDDARAAAERGRSRTRAQQHGELSDLLALG